MLLRTRRSGRRCWRACRRTAILLGFLVLVLIATYPFMKRVTYWPQFFLGLNFNWGALMGWAAARDGLGAPAVWLYLGGIAWTLGYDTIYAHQDKEDDVLIGVKSAAIVLGRRTRPFLFLFYAAAVALWGAAGAADGLGAPFWRGARARRASNSAGRRRGSISTIRPIASPSSSRTG